MYYPDYIAVVRYSGKFKDQKIKINGYFNFEFCSPSQVKSFGQTLPPHPVATGTIPQSDTRQYCQIVSQPIVYLSIKISPLAHNSSHTLRKKSASESTSLTHDKSASESTSLPHGKSASESTSLPHGKPASE